MLVDLFLGSMTILWWFFFLFRFLYQIFFTTPGDIENAKLKLAIAIPKGALITVANDAIEMLPHVANKTNKDLSKTSKEAIYLLALLRINSPSLISEIKWPLS